MTGLTDTRLQNPSIHLFHKSVRSYEERYPEMYEAVNRRHFEERFKIMEHLVEEISEVDEEEAGSSNCSSSSLSLDGPSPYALPVEDRTWRNRPKCRNSIFTHSVISSKFLRDSIDFRPPLVRGFSEPRIRQRRLHYALRGRQNGSLDQASIDLLNLPPIPESVAVQFYDEKALKFADDEIEFVDSEECSRI